MEDKNIIPNNISYLIILRYLDTAKNNTIPGFAELISVLVNKPELFTDTIVEDLTIFLYNQKSSYLSHADINNLKNIFPCGEMKIINKNSRRINSFSIKITDLVKFIMSSQLIEQKIDISDFDF